MSELYDGSIFFGNSGKQIKIHSIRLPFGTELVVKEGGIVEIIKTRAIKGKEHISFLDVDISEGETETLIESYVAEEREYTDAESVIDIIDGLAW